MTVIDKSQIFVIKESLFIAATPRDVWRVFSQMDSWPKWNTVALRAKVVEGQLWTPGACIEFCVKPSWKMLTIRAEIDACEPGRSVTWYGSRLGMHGKHTFSFTAQDGGTLAETEEIFTDVWLPLGLVMPKASIHRLFKRWLTDLKREVEGAK